MQRYGNRIRACDPPLIPLVDGVWVQYKDAQAELKKLRELLRELLAKLPHERQAHQPGIWCAGCGVARWHGCGLGPEPCKPDCVLRRAKAIIGEN